MARRAGTTIVAVESLHVAQIESWLLGRGYSTSAQSDDGETTCFEVKDLPDEARVQIEARGARIIGRSAKATAR